MTDPRVRELEETRLKKETSDLRPGDLVRIHVKVIEGGRERVQAFEGVVLKRTGSGLRERVTVRRVSHAVGIERCFLLHSPRIEKIEVLRRGRVRRARLYYLRERVGRRARVRELRQE